MGLLAKSNSFKTLENLGILLDMFYQDIVVSIEGLYLFVVGLGFGQEVLAVIVALGFVDQDGQGHSTNTHSEKNAKQNKPQKFHFASLKR